MQVLGAQRRDVAARVGQRPHAGARHSCGQQRPLLAGWRARNAVLILLRASRALRRGSGVRTAAAAPHQLVDERGQVKRSGTRAAQRPVSDKDADSCGAASSVGAVGSQRVTQRAVAACSAAAEQVPAQQHGRGTAQAQQAAAVRLLLPGAAVMSVRPGYATRRACQT